MLRKVRPSERDETELGETFIATCGVSQRQQLPRSAPQMQRQCSAGVIAFFAITNSVIAYGENASGFNSRRLH
jgi:hypothetical protein